ncbi:MAG: ATPase P [Candidatus Niyogibacteria bacterium RIFCSPLOWO2_01_FULL_45_48]|uniref:ATPase P n=2 Tax=Candidatus Niyogiibacteriota TaxID=1817912 RepID=A0A1G2F0K1_9BACT|nr:MAG: ATPase P [Candidatus Niyogibacteria bacterium RIFCSPLOWO2_01_FULL_45_48]OGZ30001.1 MAG: ATPase P [Candidatus Niyogibacteria bacterium RIFCSPHIGHO2_01_FULL_45_28]OGZ31081.1 MAG: ATPase P [Candidatus Niyogibacteria bacterium RIFCSPLOWO2_02_FULL_45_13]
MHPEIRQDMPGMCPECGMSLVKAITKHQDAITKHQDAITKQEMNDKHAGHSTQAFLRKFWVSLVLSVPVVLYSKILFELFGWSAPPFYGSAYVPAVLGSIIFFYGGWVFLASAYRELKARLPGMMTLIAVAIGAAYIYSIYVVLAGRAEEGLFWELSTLIAVMLLGHWVEMRAVSGAQGALRELSKLIPDEAEVIKNGEPQKVRIQEIKEGDVVFVRPGARIPADGVVIEGKSEVNESMITGESAPVAKAVGSEVIAGTINSDGALKVKVTKIGEHTFLAGIMRLVREAQASKSRLQILSDRAAYFLTLIAISAGGAAFVFWLYRSGFGFAIERAVAVLVIACPHALGLAVPLVASISTTLAAKSGFLVKQRLALELARKINIVLFDKTGTLTEGAFGVVSFSSDETLMLAASVDANSEHPVARGVVEEAKKRGFEIATTRSYKRIPGVGGEAEVGGRKIFVGHRGGPEIVVEADGKKIGVIKVADKIRSEAKFAVGKLKEMGIKVAMVTGDSEDVAKEVALELGIDEYFARVLPGEKSEKVKVLQEKGLKVAMVGDGINDAPALTQADLGIAIGAGTNVAIESAGIILVRNDPRDIPKIINLSRLTYSKMIQNLFWATGYNVVAIPLAAGALVFQGILLQPALAAALMSLSTIIVAFNAVLMRRKKI